MPVKVLVARNFGHLSEVAAKIVEEALLQVLRSKPEAVLGLATGNSPTGLYRLLAASANAGVFDARRVRSFNLDEYIGLPGENAQQRVLHPESYSFFMIQCFFGLLERKFAETCLPYGALIEQDRLEAEMERHPGDWELRGAGAGKSVVIKEAARSEYLVWVREQIQRKYESRIRAAGGIDLQVIGVGGQGHVAFHESGIPFEASRVLVVKLDDNTIQNAVADGHFASAQDSPRFAVSLGAELVYEARRVVLLASGERKRVPVARSLLEPVSPAVPISYGQRYAEKGGDLTYVLDAVAGADLLKARAQLVARGVELSDLRN